MLSIAGLLLTIGYLGDRLGRKPALMVGLVVFALFSLGAALSNSTDVLIAMRALMGIGPLIGGELLQHFHWSSVFYINLPVVAIGLIGSYYFIENSKADNPRKMDASENGSCRWLGYLLSPPLSPLSSPDISAQS